MEETVDTCLQHHVYNNHDEHIPIDATTTKDIPRQDDFNESDTLRLWWRHVQQIPLLSAERELELGLRIKQGDQAAYREMVESNLRLVANIARKYRYSGGHHLTLEDLIQEGCMGLMRAARKYDYRRGFKFSTYASYWIRQAISRAIAEQGRNIRLPVHMVESISRTERAKVLLTQQMQRPPSPSELSAHLELPETKLSEIMKCLNDSLSLDVPLGEEDGDVFLIDQVEDNTSQTPDDEFSLRELQAEVRHAIQTLPEREATVLKMHFGLNEQHKAFTLGEVGRQLNLTRERIRQIEKDALELLKTNAALMDLVFPAESMRPQESPKAA